MNGVLPGEDGPPLRGVPAQPRMQAHRPQAPDGNDPFRTQAPRGAGALGKGAVGRPQLVAIGLKRSAQAVSGCLIVLASWLFIPALGCFPSARYSIRLRRPLAHRLGWRSAQAVSGLWGCSGLLTLQRIQALGTVVAEYARARTLARVLGRGPRGGCT